MDIRYGNGSVPDLTAAQRQSLERVAARFGLPEPVVVQPMIGGNGCVLVEAGNMWLGVEPDGYTHS